MSWYLGEYEKMRQQGKTVRRYPNKNSSVKLKLVQSAEVKKLFLNFIGKVIIIKEN